MDLVRAPDGLEWTVVLDDSLMPLSGAGNRVARIVAVPDVAAAVDAMRPFAKHLQNVGLGAVGEEFRRTARELAVLGVSRVCEPGAMTRPTMPPGRRWFRAGGRARAAAGHGRVGGSGHSLTAPDRPHGGNRFPRHPGGRRGSLLWPS